MPNQDPAGTDDRRAQDPMNPAAGDTGAPQPTVPPAGTPMGGPPVAVVGSDPGMAGRPEPDPAEAEFERLTGHPIDARPTPATSSEDERSDTNRPG
jgi:hypothetical protein